MPIHRAGEIDLYYDRRGEGSPLLFISGSGGDLRTTPNVFDGPFPKHFDTLAYDQRGLGRSAKPDGNYTMADYADDAANLLKAIDWQTALVVGVSFGGMVAQELAIRHPQAITRLVLCCTSPGGAGGASYPLHTIEHLSRADRARHMIPISDTRHDAAWAKANPDAYDKLFAVASADPFADEPGYALGQHRQLEARSHHDTWERLSRIACPTMIAAGRYDGIATPATQEKMASRIPGSRLRSYEGGHLFLLQDRQAFPEIIAFLKDA
jgi:3-oxoadipate enol-lactonase